MRTILTILLTSLAWAFAIACFFELREPAEAETVEPTTVVEQPTTPAPTQTSKREQRAAKKAEKAEQKAAQKAEKAEATTPAPTPTPQQNEQPATQSIDYAREIDGRWTPVEGAEYALEFTKYGTAIQHRGYQNRVKYSLKGQKLKIYLDSNARCEITNQGDDYYLEIYNSKEFSGKYKRVSQPRKIAMRPLDAANYAELICGKWSPINGQEYALEFSKYGTAIQHRGYENRVEYTLNGSSLRIYLDSSASVAISEDASYYYLEIYNSEDFSGRYRKSK